MATAGEATITSLRAISFYLPQFYPTPENDSWWGPGFTEWTNVVQGEPLFEGHYQPRLPADLGFWDARVPEVRQEQAELAREYGIEGFCYWHYWFHGTRVLNRPFDEVLASGEPDLPFCLSWANETWERRWHGTGAANEVLREQTYSEEDDLAHARWLATAFSDPRYIRVDDRPIFLVYRPFDLPDARRTTETFRAETVRIGLPEPYIIGINAHNPTEDTRPLGFDSTLNFEPQLSAVPGPTDPGLKIYDYAIATRSMLSQERDYPFHPCVMVSWDNSPRRGENGIVFINSTPEAFEQHLRAAAESLAEDPPEYRLLFLNAWNEWAEGNYLEPDLRYGHGWLNAVRHVAHGDDAPVSARDGTLAT
jgi:lipopolysaccharide biosynthesis protein